MQKKKKKKISGSIIILMSLIFLAIVFIIAILYLMTIYGIPEPSTLIMSFFSWLIAIEGTVLGMRVSRDKYLTPECSEDIEIEIDE